MSTLDRPDLDEFLSALNGFLDKPTAARDPGYLKFLEIFCRTVGSGEGHLLKPAPDGTLTSLVSFGVSSEFDRAYNSQRDPQRPGPLDIAFREQKVVALVEVKKGAAPDWYVDVAAKQGFRSVIAVPLLGHERAVGILCAYYRDVCLFDQGTLDRLMVIGRMVGAATEKSEAAGRASEHDAKELVSDGFLRLLTMKALTKPQIFQALSRVAGEAVMLDGLVTGPLREADGQLAMSVAAGEGVPSSLIGHRLVLPALLQRQFQSPSGMGSVTLTSVQATSMAPYLHFPSAAVSGARLVYQGTLEAGLIVWREASRPFDADEEHLLMRLAGMSVLALQTL